LGYDLPQVIALAIQGNFIAILELTAWMIPTLACIYIIIRYFPYDGMLDDEPPPSCAPYVAIVSAAALCAIAIACGLYLPI